jgi:hypothetical protein
MVMLASLFLSVFVKLLKATVSWRHVYLSALPHAATRPPTGLIFMTCVFFENLTRKLNVHWNLTTIACTLHEYLWWTYLCCSMTPPPEKTCLLWDNVEKHGRARQTTDDIVIWGMRLVCWITKSTDTKEYVILIAFPRQQWLRERASVRTLSCCVPGGTSTWSPHV